MKKRIEYRPVRQVPHSHSGVYCVGLGPWEYCYEKHSGSHPLAKRCRPARMVNARWNEKQPCGAMLLVHSSRFICIVPSIPRPRSHEAPSREIVTIAVTDNILILKTLFGRKKSQAVMPHKDGKELFGNNVCCKEVG